MNAKDDYLNILEETKVKLNTFYTIDLPAAFDVNVHVMYRNYSKLNLID